VEYSLKYPSWFSTFRAVHLGLEKSQSSTRQPPLPILPLPKVALKLARLKLAPPSQTCLFLRFRNNCSALCVLRSSASRRLLSGNDVFIFRSQHLYWAALQRVMCHGTVFPGTQNQADRRVLMRQGPMPSGIVRYRCICPASACVNRSNFRSISTRHLSRRWKSTRSTRYHASPTRQSFLASDKRKPLA